MTWIVSAPGHVSSTPDLAASKCPPSESMQQRRPPLRAEAQYDGFTPLGQLRFTFEKGSLGHWHITHGQLGQPISDAASLPRWKQKPFNQEGRFHLSTINTGEGFSDQQTAVVESPVFVINGERASFLVSGGFDPKSLYVGLFDADTGERLMEAGGARGPQMHRVIWHLQGLRGRQVILRVVDQNTGPWGHLTFDDFSVDGQIVD